MRSNFAPVWCAMCSMATNPALRDRETRGVNNSSRHYVLDEETINSFRDRVTHEFPAGQPDVLFTSIDPSGGGSGSDFAIFTIAIVAGQQVVVSSMPCIAQRRRQTARAAPSLRMGQRASARDRLAREGLRTTRRG